MPATAPRKLSASGLSPERTSHRSSGPMTHTAQFRTQSPLRMETGRRATSASSGCPRERTAKTGIDPASPASSRRPAVAKLLSMPPLGSAQQVAEHPRPEKDQGVAPLPLAEDDLLA